MSEWRPIDTAPKDGREVITCVAGFDPIIGARWVTYDGKSRWSVDPETFMEEEHWQMYWSFVSYDPTHWMPLPAPPKQD